TPTRPPRSAAPHLDAEVAELADAQASGACGRKVVEVQVLSSAPTTWSTRPTLDGARCLRVYLTRSRHDAMVQNALLVPIFSSSVLNCSERRFSNRTVTAKLREGRTDG